MLQQAGHATDGFSGFGASSRVSRLVSGSFGRLTRPPGCRRYVIERPQQFVQQDRDLSLAEVAAHAGFSDQSQFSRHFKRLVGVTPGQLRMPARIA